MTNKKILGLGLFFQSAITERTLAARFHEHMSTAMNAQGKYKSAMLQHARENGHHFRLEDATILGWEQDWVKRGIFEALCIKILNPSINIDPGRHTVSSHFDQILKEVIKPPPDPAPHNPDNESLINTAPRRQGRPRKNQPTPSPIADPPTRQSHSQPTENNGDHMPLPQRQSQRIRDRQNRQQPASQ